MGQKPKNEILTEANKIEKECVKLRPDVSI